VDRADGVEVGLRGKLRFNASNLPENTFNSNGDGTYSFDTGTPPTGFGFDPNSPTTPVWSFEWSINTNYDDSTSWNLDDLTYNLQLDFDPSLGVNFRSFDPINVPFADHAIGTNATGNGGGSTATDATDYASLIANNNVAQNSWNMEFFNEPPWDIFDPDVDGTYDFNLGAYANGNRIAQTSIQIIAGEGGQPVPDAGSTAALMGLGLLALAGLRRRFQRSG